MNKSKIITEEVVWQREAGMSWTEISRLLGIDRTVARYHGNPDHKRRVKAYYAQRWRERRGCE